MRQGFNASGVQCISGSVRRRIISRRGEGVPRRRGVLLGNRRGESVMELFGLGVID
jgi:hypothetical protein